MITVEPILLEVAVSTEEYDLVVSGDESLDVDLGTAIVVNQIVGEEYEGPYEVTPKIESQMLATRNKTMIDNVTVLEIPYAEVTNPVGGKTAIIGGI